MSSPAIDILLAVYRPNFQYFTRLLESLNAQDAQNLRLLVLDDSDDEPIHDRIKTLLKRKIFAFPYELRKNAGNLGSLGTFAVLTEWAAAPLLAYCDQDDIWKPRKLSCLASLLQDPAARLAYCNQSIIDGQGKILHPTLQDMRRRFVHRHGEGLFSYFLLENCVTGACMMARRETAQAALPFAPDYVHDEWIALFASAGGSVAYTSEPLVEYRLHGGNVVGMASLSGITGRDSYVKQRIARFLRMLGQATTRFPDPPYAGIIARQQEALLVRQGYLSGQRLRHLFPMIRYGWKEPVRLGFELLLGILPGHLATRLVRFGQTH